MDTQTWIIILINIIIHYTSEAISEYPNYSCPPYCDVDHKHIENDDKKGKKEIPSSKVKGLPEKEIWQKEKKIKSLKTLVQNL